MKNAPQPGREAAAAAIWPAIAEAPAEDRAANVRRSAAIRWLFGLAVAALVFFVFERPVFAAVIASITSTIFLLALVSPLGAHAKVDGAFALLARGVGTFLSVVLLAPVFYLFITPMGLLARRGTKDTLKRSFDVQTDSYWQKRDESGPRLDRPY